METLDMVTTEVVARPKPVLDLGAVALAPHDEPAIPRWPGWAQLAILLGASAALWAGIAWVALRVLRLG